MKIYAGNKLLNIPTWITASDNTVTVNAHSVKLNDRHGEYLTGEDIYTARTFNCSGNIITDKYQEVEKLRSALTSSLVGKELKVYRDDADEVFYFCRLIGAIKTGYHNGKNLAKAFSFSFTLKALDPFGYGKEKIETVTGGFQTITIQNDGNCITIPKIEISDVDHVEGSLFECNNSFLEVNKKIPLKKGEKLSYKNGLLYAGENDIVKNMSDKSIITPLHFIAGENKVKIKLSAGTIKFIFNGRYA